MQFSAATREILQLVEQKTGKKVELLTNTSLPVLATVKMARGAIPFHLITYNPNKRGIDYNIAYQCGFILRLYENLPSERFEFASKGTGQNLVYRALEGNKKIRKMGLREPAIRQFAEQIFNGLMTQLRSVPVGLRIDKWLWDSYSALRDAQKVSITRQQQDNVQSLSHEIRATVPTTVFAANTAMNAAYALFCDRLLEKELYIIPYRTVGFENSGERLLEIASEVSEDAMFDRQLIDLWGDELEISDWYRWLPIESSEEAES